MAPGVLSLLRNTYLIRAYLSVWLSVRRALPPEENVEPLTVTERTDDGG